jgi:hypothetical protein
MSPNAPFVVSALALITLGSPRNRNALSALVLEYALCSVVTILSPYCPQTLDSVRAFFEDV